jgi:hypothetical protein
MFAALKYGLVAAIASASTLGIMATEGRASHAHNQRLISIATGDRFFVRSIDLGCVVAARDPDGIEKTGPIVFCGRWSAAGDSRSVGISKYHYYVTDESSNSLVARYFRAP